MSIFRKHIFVLSVLGLTILLAHVGIFVLNWDEQSDSDQERQTREVANSTAPSNAHSVTNVRGVTKLPPAIQLETPLMDNEVEPPEKLAPLRSRRQWEALIKRASSGDRMALDDVYREAGQCLGIAKSQQAREKLLEAMSTDDDETNESRARSIARMRDKFAKCDLIPGEVHEAFERQLYALRAETGSTAERIEYTLRGYPRDTTSETYNEEMQEYRERSRRFLDEGVAQGEPDALAALAHAYRRSNIYRPDPARAYVYAYAHALAINQIDETILRRLTQMEGGLIQETIPALRAEAESIANCCR